MTKSKEGDDLTLFVSCLPGLEPILSHELTALNIPHSKTKGGVNIRQASVDTITKCHLFLGSASHVLVRCGKAFNVRGFAELSRKVARMSWNQWINEDTILDVKVTCSKSKIYHTAAVAQRVEASIHKAFGRTAPQGSSSSPVVSVNVRVHRDVVQISIDTSETPLHQRGWRLETAKAPLREDIAYAMLYAAGCTDYEGLLDPFCGAGTIAIEGASMKAGLPPGRLRDVALKGTPLYNPDQWSELLCQSLEESDKKLKGLDLSKPLVIAGDRDKGGTAAAKANAERAGLLEVMDISTKSLSDYEWFENPESAPSSVLIATNPPFGKRISSSRQKSARRFDELLPLYQSLGKEIKGLRSKASTVVLTNKIDLARKMGVPNNSALFSTQHGGLPVVAMGSNIKNPVKASKDDGKPSDLNLT
jgi:putative N6-adenine-specific DNA methylase